MRISVVIPSYNSSGFIRHTLDSVLAQTFAPCEVLVLDDGSTDDTVQILQSYGTRIKILQQKNGGTANARNALCRQAAGDVVAFLDHDDLWHPEYLRHHRDLLERYPEAVVSFLGHETFVGQGGYEWRDAPRDADALMELIASEDFIRRYHTGISPFMSMSFCCVPNKIIGLLGSEPFSTEVSGADDLLLFNRLPLFGPIAFHAKKLAAYRITSQAQSVNRLKASALAVRSMESLRRAYLVCKKRELQRAYEWAMAVQRREYAKILMGGQNPGEARRQFLRSALDDGNPKSALKSLLLYSFTWLPKPMQPGWLPPMQMPRYEPSSN
jgi:glycosyltransferase involved in cell wall biosynthesis